MSIYSTIQRQAYTADVKLPPPPGEAIFIGSGGATQSFVVPSGVYFISVVAVSASPTLACQLKRGATVLLDTTAAIGVGNDGGGNGGPAGTNNTGQSFYNSYNSGGGAAGYSGNGGAGGLGRFDGAGQLGGSGAGGGGGGGKGGDGNGSQMVSYGATGGGVGLFGQGANGGPGANGSPIQSPYVGGGANNSPGGNLRYRNNIAVTPGETLTIALGSTVATASMGPGMRIIWGKGRAFPSTDCGPTVPKGQAYIAGANTTWTVPANITSISIACQQNNGTSAAVSVVAAGNVVCRAENGNRVGTGGGDGGLPGQGGLADSGGGGGGGYFGNGGNGGMYAVIANNAWAVGAGAPGAADSSAAGGGASTSRAYQGSFGGGGNATYSYVRAGPGGDVGIEGAAQGQGLGGSSGYRPGGSSGVGPINGLRGGGQPGVRGGALAWLATLAVTPGQVLTVNAAGGRVRFVWGPGRSYPSNAGEV